MEMNEFDVERRKGALSSAALVGLAFLAAIVLAAIVCYSWFKNTNNRMVALDEGINGSWSQIEVVLQRRFDLIPNLVNTVKGFAEQERGVLTEITRLRSQWGAAKTPEEKIQAANGIESALGRLMVIVERYPDLKSNQNFLSLQSQLEGTENRIAVERRRYNEAVQGYNTYIRQFPNSILAGMLNFEVKDSYFEANESAQDAPQVSF